MKALLIVNPQKRECGVLARAIEDYLRQQDIDVSWLSYIDNRGFNLPIDVAFSLGGDGTVLFAARSIASYGIPIIPVNLGTMGFIATVPPDRWLSAFEGWRKEPLAFSERIMLRARIVRQKASVFDMTALNDAVISASGIAKTIRLSAATERFPIAAYRSDGLIAATPTGSSAYSASAGGPVLDPESDALILTPICPFTDIRHPLVIPARQTIIITIEKEQRSGVLLTIDGQVTEGLERGDTVHISRSEHNAKLIGADRSAFYNALRLKLTGCPSASL